VLAPGSHTAEVATPSTFLAAGPDALDASDELLLRPPMRPGDVLIHSSTMVHGVRIGRGGPRFVTCEFRTDDSAQGLNQGVEPAAPPAWVAALTPTQRASLGWHSSGPNGATAADAALMSDGWRSWVAPAETHRSSRSSHSSSRSGSLPTVTPEAPALEEMRRRHPGVYQQRTGDNPEGTVGLIDEMELYRWDCAGHLVLRGVMDERWISAALDAIKSAPTTWAKPAKGPLSDTSSYFAGSTGGPGVELPAPGGLCALPTPHCEPFHRMLDEPRLVKTLRWMMGAGWVMGPPGLRTANEREQGLFLHVGGHPSVTSNLINFKRGVHMTDFINIAWQLTDVNCGHIDGGYICIPGSHRASVGLPFSKHTASWMDPDGGPRPPPDGFAIEPLPLVESGHMVRPTMRAGDVLLFMGASQTHGADRWRSKEPRRAILHGVWSARYIDGRRPRL
jgi:ectoine hydroxylase-related dioxygenase (phytanoyl-CoA dioxygenase family)